MPSPFRILAILLHSLAVFLPYVLLMIYPFRNQMRFSGTVTALFAGILAVLQIAADVAVGLGLAGSAILIQLLLAAAHVGFYFLIIRPPYGKVLRNMLIVFCLAAASVAISEGVEYLLFPVLFQEHYRLPGTLFLMILAGRLTPLALSRSASSAEKKASSAKAAPKAAAPTEAPRPKPAAPVSAPQPAIEVPAEPPKGRPQVSAPQAAAADPLEILQYGSLQERIAESEMVQQELRRHIDTMTYHLSNQEFAKLRAHFTSLQEQFPKGIPTAYCENAALNSVLTYFIRTAGYCGANVAADVRLPKDLPIAGQDLSVLIGNLLDNALDACKAQRSSDRRIYIKGSVNGKALRFVIENTYEGTVQQDSTGAYLSFKHPGRGIGREGAGQIAARYHGALQINYANGIFLAAVTLNP